MFDYAIPTDIFESELGKVVGIIFELYLMVFERIDTEHGRFTTEELNPTPEESRQRVSTTIMNSRTIKI